MSSERSVLDETSLFPPFECMDGDRPGPKKDWERGIFRCFEGTQMPTRCDTITTKGDLTWSGDSAVLTEGGTIAQIHFEPKPDRKPQDDFMRRSDEELGSIPDATEGGRSTRDAMENSGASACSAAGDIAAKILDGTFQGYSTPGVAYGHVLSEYAKKYRFKADKYPSRGRMKWHSRVNPQAGSRRSAKRSARMTGILMNVAELDDRQRPYLPSVIFSGEPDSALIEVSNDVVCFKTSPSADSMRGTEHFAHFALINTAHLHCHLNEEPCGLKGCGEYRYDVKWLLNTTYLVPVDQASGTALTDTVSAVLIKWEGSEGKTRRVSEISKGRFRAAVDIAIFRRPPDGWQYTNGGPALSTSTPTQAAGDSARTGAEK